MGYMGDRALRKPHDMEKTRHGDKMGAAEVRGFLTHLTAERKVAAAAQNQALNALVFLYREVIGGELERIEDFEPAKRRNACRRS